MVNASQLLWVNFEPFGADKTGLEFDFDVYYSWFILENRLLTFLTHF
jgi:hypothetical protein